LKGGGFSFKRQVYYGNFANPRFAELPTECPYFKRYFPKKQPVWRIKQRTVRGQYEKSPVTSRYKSSSILQENNDATNSVELEFFNDQPVTAAP